MDRTPSPEIIMDTEPSIQVITRGKQAFDTLILALTTSSNYILTEEAKQCTLLSRMYGQATKGRIAFWMPSAKESIAGARISFAFDKTSYKFSDPRVRKTCPYVDRFHIRVTEQPIDSLCNDAPFSIVTYMPGEIPIEFEDDQALESILQALLYTRLLPFVGHLKPNGKVDVYRLNYGPSLSLMWEDRALRHTDGSIPYFEKIKDKRGWIADIELAKVLRERILTFNEPWFYQSAFMALRYFGVNTIERANLRVFDAFGLSLLPTEMKAIEENDKKLVEVPVA
jgi:hypothetical protein